MISMIDGNDHYYCYPNFFDNVKLVFDLPPSM